MTHPIVPFDEGLLAEVRDRLTLRKPNAAGLTAVIKNLSEAAGEPWEGVCDLATAVGKTYLAAGIIEYLATCPAGIRNFLIVTPGDTVYRKTVANYTPGNRKSVRENMTTNLAVITKDNFDAAWVAAAMADADVTKVFIFNIQQLLRPSTTENRRTREVREWLGTGLYEYLQNASDLVVLSDEHHVYAPQARAFNAAITDLHAAALVGLTATPAPSQQEQVIYRYTLAEAIRDRLVKTPVIVGRSDGRSDLDTQLRDGLHLLARKQEAADLYVADNPDKEPVTAVMLLVAASIESATEIAALLRSPQYLDSEEAVLEIHSDTTDAELERLASVEEPGSPVRVIVSVQMLGVGWDVRNVFVICSRRPSVSEVLTEQTLGRGLRLPWGEYTHAQLLDTVEVLTHESYRDLLAKAGTLLEGLVEQREAVSQREREAADRRARELARRAAAAAAAAEAARRATVEVDLTDTTLTDEPQAAEDGVTETTTADGAEAGPVAPTDEAPAEEAGGVVITDLDEHQAEADAALAAMTQVAAIRDGLAVALPRITRQPQTVTFSLTSVPEDRFRELGTQLGANRNPELLRELLDVTADLHLASRAADDRVAATQSTVIPGTVLAVLKDGIVNSDYVSNDPVSINYAGRCAGAIVAGAGGEDALADVLHPAITGANRIIESVYRTIPIQYTFAAEDGPVLAAAPNTRSISTNKHLQRGVRDKAFGDWSRSLRTLVWFDSAPELALANLLDRSDGIEYWVRLLAADLPVEWQGGTYQPDFFVRTSDGGNLVIEVKADYQLGHEAVAGKKVAAEEWCRAASTLHGEGWDYRLFAQSDIYGSATWEVLAPKAR